MIGSLQWKTKIKVITMVMIVGIIAGLCFGMATVQAGTVVSDVLHLDGYTGKIVDEAFDSGCKLIGGTTYNLAKSLYDSGVGAINLLTGQHSATEKAAGWAEVGLNLIGAGTIIATLVTGTATLPIIAAITLGVAAGKTLIGVIKNGDKILSWLSKFLGSPLKSLLNVFKPNIYIYSDKNREVNVKLSPYEYITESIPRYDPQKGWKALVFNGSLDGCNNYLFYEARIPDQGLQREEGFSVRQAALQSDMLMIMDMYGFNRKETNDFLEYWTNKLRGSEDYLFFPQETETIDKIMPLKVNPQPDNIFRLWFLIEKDEGQSFSAVHEVRKIIRKSYTVVEWGGIMGSAKTRK